MKGEDRCAQCTCALVHSRRVQLQFIEKFVKFNNLHIFYA